MHDSQSRPIPSRRTVLKLAAIAGVAAIGGYILFEYTPWQNYDRQAGDSREPFEKGTALSAQMEDLVRYATLAPNGHNAQPWKFLIKENAIEIHPDYTRHLATVDPNDRELWISLGAALENLNLAARAAGYMPRVTYPETADFIHVGLTPATPQGVALFDAIPLRQNTRSEYDGKPINAADLEQVQAVPLEPGVALYFVSGPSEVEMVLEYVNQGNLTQYADKAFVDELTHWVRFNQKEALASLDGLYAVSSGSPQVPRWLGEIVLTGIKPQAQADGDAKKLRSSSGAVVVTSESEDRTAWVRTGQVYERMALMMTSLNIKSVFLNQPIEVANLRGQFQSALGLGSALPQLLVRYGYAAPMTPSLRRPVDQVLMQA